MAMDHDGEVRVECSAADFQATVDFFTGLHDGAGTQIFVIAEVMPADSPREILVKGAGLGIRMVRLPEAEESCVFIHVKLLHIPKGEQILRSPCGAKVEFCPFPKSAPWHNAEYESRHLPLPLLLPKLSSPAPIMNRKSGDGFQTGRAGMLYRDLVPCRLGGAFIASEIHIPKGGPVPDYVHFHLVRFQLIYCIAGWVRLVYEGEGEPFVLRAGELVVQPPTIRHRVLESSDQLEVLELGVPAEHSTRADPHFHLPTGTENGEEDASSHHACAKRARHDKAPESTEKARRTFGAQRFVRFEASSPQEWRKPVAGCGLETLDTGVRDGTGGLADVSVCRYDGSACEIEMLQQQDPILFARVNQGTAVLETLASLNSVAEKVALAMGDTFTVPQGHFYRLREQSTNFEFLRFKLHTYQDEI